MQVLSDIRLLILLAVANSAPIIAKLLLGQRFALPLDGNRSFLDGRPIFGSSKTIRGIVAAMALTSACALLIGLEPGLGAVIGLTAMIGDLCSSFCKRRLGLKPSSKATGLDQIPESLFPLLACRQALALSVADIAAVTAIFFVGEILLSRVLFRLHLRDRPY